MTNLSTDDPNHLPSLSIDWDLYGSMLEDSDLTNEQKREFIETLWNIVVAFVDLGFGIHPLQQACGEGDELSTLIHETMLSCEHSKNITESETQA